MDTGAIMNSLVATGLYLERFEEHPDLFWNQFPCLPGEISWLPAAYIFFAHAETIGYVII